MIRYHPGDLVTVKGSAKGPAPVLAASFEFVLIRRDTGQWAYPIEDVEPYKGDSCDV
jgi:hypothetical protein